MIKVNRGRRALYVAAAVALVVVSMLSGFAGKAAAGQVQQRSITMSSSNAGASSTSYHVVFKIATAGNVGGIVVDFCDNTPLIGDTTCTVPTGFTVTATPTFTTTGTMGGGWSATQLNTGQVFLLSNSTPVNFAVNDTVDFTITSATNPTTDNHSFYARIVTYATSAAMSSGYTVSGTTRAANPGGVDNGGIAMSTAKVINITARVMDTLSFCVYNTTCGDDPSITLGHGANNVLDTSAIDTNVVNFSLSTNAQNGGFVRLKGDTLKAGTNDIDPAGATPFTFTAGTEKFGVKVTTSGTNITAASPYNSATADTYGFDVTTAGDNVTTTYGDLLATLTAPANNSVSTITFAAAASNTTAAGIYTAAEQLIATGTF